MGPILVGIRMYASSEFVYWRRLALFEKNHADFRCAMLKTILALENDWLKQGD